MQAALAATDLWKFAKKSALFRLAGTFLQLLLLPDGGDHEDVGHRGTGVTATFYN